MRVEQEGGGGEVSAVVYDLSGRRVRVLEESLPFAGSYEFVWDGMDDDGRPARPGIYLVRARSLGKESSTRVAWLGR